MKRRSSHRIFALLLAVLLGLGGGLSALQAVVLCVQPAVAADAGASGQGSGYDCAGRDDGAQAIACEAALFCATVAVLPSAAVPVETTPANVFPLSTGLPGQYAGAPDPGPPRTLAFL